MITTTNLELLLGLLLPVIVSVIKQEHFANAINAIIALVVYIIFGLAAVLATGQTFDMNNVVPTVTLFVTEGTVAYQLFWKNFEGTTG